jgi:hypothetical protein
VHALGFFHRENRHNVRMIERSDCPRFTLKAREPFRIASHVGRQHLEGDIASELGIDSAKHLAHAAGADRLCNLVMRQRPADQSIILAARAVENAAASQNQNANSTSTAFAVWSRVSGVPEVNRGRPGFKGNDLHRRSKTHH